MLALDVQQKAVDATNARLAAAGLAEVGRAVRADHARLGQLVHRGSADGVVFNFGYLPGADHALFTVPQSSLPAVEAALEALKPAGCWPPACTAAGPTATGEKRALLGIFPGAAPRRSIPCWCAVCQLGAHCAAALFCAEKEERN